MERQKRVLAIHDISCVGKCSLTVALPVISAGGIETSVLPTAVLSTHTGGFTGFTYRDLTGDLMPICRHWASLGLQFDAIYTGFLGSFEQLTLVEQIFELFGDHAVKLVDPVMADNGKLYSVFNQSFPAGMRRLCEKADIIVPNITEACYMLDIPYHAAPYQKEYIAQILNGLKKFGTEKIVLTGISLEANKLGVAVCDGKSSAPTYYFADTVPGTYHGTGDLFASALLTGYLNDNSLMRSAEIAVDFTVGSISETYHAKTDVRFGVNFESQLPSFVKTLKG